MMLCGFLRFQNIRSLRDRCALLETAEQICGFFVRKRLGTEKEEFMMIVKAGKGILTKESKNTGGEYT